MIIFLSQICSTEKKDRITLVLYVTCEGLGSSKALLRSYAPPVQCRFSVWRQRLLFLLPWDWKYFCGYVPNPAAVIQQGQCCSS